MRATGGHAMGGPFEMIELGQLRVSTTSGRQMAKTCAQMTKVANTGGAAVSTGYRSRRRGVTAA
jgi:hypothetical protein